MFGRSKNAFSFFFICVSPFLISINTFVFQAYEQQLSHLCFFFFLFWREPKSGILAGGSQSRGIGSVSSFKELQIGFIFGYQMHLLKFTVIIDKKLELQYVQEVFSNLHSMLTI